MKLAYSNPDFDRIKTYSDAERTFTLSPAAMSVLLEYHDKYRDYPAQPDLAEMLDALVLVTKAVTAIQDTSIDVSYDDERNTTNYRFTVNATPTPTPLRAV